MTEASSEDVSGMIVWKRFQETLSEIRAELSNISSAIERNDNLDNSDYVKKINQLKDNSRDLQQYITSSVSIMPAYDVRRTQEMIDKLNADIKAVELLLKPKKKFAFSSRSKPAATSEKKIDTLQDVKDDTRPPETSKATDPTNTLDTKVIANLIDSHVYLSKQHFAVVSTANESYLQKQLLIRSCSNSVISAITLLGSVRIEETTLCTIYLGPCCTSVYLESCRGCIIFAACHQLRIHESDGCNMYVRVNSHPIIEDCQNMGFAPYLLRYLGIDDDFKTSALFEAKDWSNVIDFRWHKKTASPNWHVIAEEERLTQLPEEISALGWELQAITSTDISVTSDEI